MKERGGPRGGGDHKGPRDGDPPGHPYYEKSSVVAEYLAFHYPADDPLESLLGEQTPPLEDRFPFAIRKLWTPKPDAEALDAGCAVGAVTFDLARDHRAAWGLDRSAALVAAARNVQQSGGARYDVVVEGELRRTVEARVQTRSNAQFLCGDALALPFENGRFATIVALNLVDRLPDPARGLDELRRVLAPGGELVLSSPFTWLEKFTPKDRWLGGTRGSSGDVRGAARVRTLLEPELQLTGELRLPFFIPHHARSGQLAVTHVLTFRRPQ